MMPSKSSCLTSPSFTQDSAMAVYGQRLSVGRGTALRPALSTHFLTLGASVQGEEAIGIGSAGATIPTKRRRDETWMSAAIAILGGVGLFLLGMTVITDRLKALAGSALRTVLGKAADILVGRGLPKRGCL